MRPQFNSLPFYHKLASVLVILIALGYLVILSKDLLSPVIFSCLFSILLLPLATFLEKKFRLAPGRGLHAGRIAFTGRHFTHRVCCRFPDQHAV